MTNLAVVVLCSLVATAALGGCSPTELKSEHHELRPVAQEFSVAAPAFPQAMAALGMQVAQPSSTPNTITVMAVTPEGVRVQITLRPSGPSSSSLDVQGDAEQQALGQLATRLAESLAKQLAQQGADSHTREVLEALGYVGPGPETPETNK